MRYMGSKSRIAKHIVPIIQQYIDDNNIKEYIEPFCLSGDTILFTDTGIKTMEELMIGDKILDDEGHYTTVVNKVKSNKDKGKAVKVKGNVNFKGTDNHMFYIGGQETRIDNLKVGDSLDVGISTNSSNEHIDMADYITISSNSTNGRSGSIVSDTEVKLYHNAQITNRIIPITKELMRCYGLVVSEGDRSNITMHENEIHVLEEFMNYYKNILDLDESNKKYVINKNRHSCQLSVPCKTMYEKLFFKAMRVGYGARNKNISFLFGLSNDMILEAIRYMHIGDGSCSLKSGKYRSWNYKTSSKTLAYQLQAILSIKFGIKSTFTHGMNKERYIDGRKLESSDYYNISVTRDEDITFLLGEKGHSIRHERTKQFIITEINDISDVFYDITVDNTSHRFIINGGIVTHNCGGANVIDKIRCETKIGSDLNKYLIALLKRAQSGQPLLDEVPRELYNAVRSNPDKYEDWYVGNVGLLASYCGRDFSGGYAQSGYEKTAKGERYRDYYQEAKRNLLAQKDDLEGIIFRCCHYKAYVPVSDGSPSMIYIDPPYQNTKQYNVSKDFNYEEFWDIMREWSKDNIVLISELQAPDDFECIWQQEVNRSIKATDKSRATEKLFKYKG